MLDMLSQVPDESKNDRLAYDSIFTEVMGKEKPSRVRGYDLGVIPTMLCGTSRIKMHTEYTLVLFFISL